jgi:hypothetical protein
VTWYTEGVKSTPSSGTVLADTGEMEEGSRSVAFWVSANVLATVRLEVRNAANNANVIAQTFHLSAVSPVATPELSGVINLATDERIRIVTSGALALGEIQASLFVQ